MKISITILVLLASWSLAALSIFDIQYTTTPGIDNTYPSPFVGKSVTIEGIVVATNYQGGGFFLNETISGAWRGILVLDRKYPVSIGDKVQISGIVNEVYGMTCIQDLSKLRKIDSNRPLPQFMNLTTSQLIRSDEAESYEGVLVRVLNATCSQVTGTKGRFGVTDGTGQCLIYPGVFGDRTQRFSIKTGDQFGSIQGLLIYSFGAYSLSPRNRNDISVMQPVFNQSTSWGRIKSIYK